MSYWYHGYKKCLDFIYPPLCLHCDSYISEGAILFCPSCSCFFDYLPPDQSDQAACFAYTDSVATFVKALKGKRMPFLAKTAAALLLVHFDRLDWPSPDLIVPVPCRALLPYNDHVYMMAGYLSRWLKRKRIQPIRRRRGRPRQASLSKEERMTLSSQDFMLKRTKRIAGKKILLIDDVMTTKSTVRALSSLLEEGGGTKVYSLSVAESLLAPATCTSP